MKMLRDIDICRKIIRRRIHDNSISPLEKENLKVCAILHIRKLKRKITEYCIIFNLKIPIIYKDLFTTKKYRRPVTLRTEMYFKERAKRSKWANQVNEALGLEYSLPRNELLHI